MTSGVRHAIQVVFLFPEGDDGHVKLNLIESDETFLADWVEDWVSSFAYVPSSVTEPVAVDSGKSTSAFRAVLGKSRRAANLSRATTAVSSLNKTLVTRFKKRFIRSANSVSSDSHNALSIDWSQNSLPAVFKKFSRNSNFKFTIMNKSNNISAPGKAGISNGALESVLTKLRGTPVDEPGSPTISAVRPDDMADLSLMLTRLRISLLN
jgi:hypothetical protein